MRTRRDRHDGAALRADLQADEDDPSRVAPSSEGVVTFPGLPGKVREWLARELRSAGRKGDGPSGKGD